MAEFAIIVPEIAAEGVECFGGKEVVRIFVRWARSWLRFGFRPGQSGAGSKEHGQDRQSRNDRGSRNPSEFDFIHKETG